MDLSTLSTVSDNSMHIVKDFTDHMEETACTCLRNSPKTSKSMVGWGQRQCSDSGRIRTNKQCSYRHDREGSIPSSGISLLLAFILLLLHTTEAIQWMAVAKRRDDSWNKTTACNTEGLVRLQRQLCTRHLELMPSVAQASRQAAQVCQELFFDSRWNCSSVLRAPKFYPDLKGGSREQAVVHALASASLSQTVAKHCSTGLSMKCSCGTLPTDQPEGDFKWGGCPDNVQFGLSFSEAFTTAPYAKNNRSKKAIMNLQNELVGRRAMSSSLTTSCKCHGVSGSCTTKTCWKSLSDMRTVGSIILERYAVAVEVVPARVRVPRLANHLRPVSTAILTSGMESEGEDSGEVEPKIVRVPRIARSAERRRSVSTTTSMVETAVAKGGKKRGRKRTERRLVPFLRGKTEYNEDELIFYTKSPDYCLPEEDLGSVGTRGRECQKDDPGSAGCGSMCCGRGFTTEMVDVQYRCECKYFWCCYVKCKTCTKTVEVARCK